MFWVTGRRIGSRRFSSRSLSKAGEGWIQSGMGMARYVGVLTSLSSQYKQGVPNEIDIIGWFFLNHSHSLINHQFTIYMIVLDLHEHHNVTNCSSHLYSAVEGSLSSSKIKKKINASKVRVNKDTDLNCEQRSAPKTG